MIRSYLLILGTVALGATGQLCVKAGAMKLRPAVGSLSEALGFLFQVARSPLLVGGLLAWSLGAMLWIMALSRFQLTYAYPMLSLGYVIVVVGSWFLFNEQVTLARLVGIAVVVVGVVLVSRT